MRAWQRRFSHKILERGYQYYEDELVDEMQTEQEITTATIKGSKPYHVQVRYQNGHLSWATCDCPYARNGRYCKHEAALLYALDAKKGIPPVLASKRLELFVEDYAVIDIETTGLDDARDAIIEVGAIRVYPGGRLETYTSLIHTDQKLSSSIETLTGITQDMVSKAPPLEKVLREFGDFVRGTTLIGHNVPFDLAFLKRDFLSCLHEEFDPYYIDTLYLARRYLKNMAHYDLATVASYFKIDTGYHHRALQDVLMTLGIYRCFKEIEAFRQLCYRLENEMIIP